jgi:hypothetical protein
MATDNKGVMIYLPKDLEEYITNFCTQYNITRKDKDGNLAPSLGTGVVTYLRRAILSQSPDNVLTKPAQSVDPGLNEEEVLNLIDRYFTSKLPSENSDRIVTDENLSPEDAGIGESSSLGGIENAVHQVLIDLDVPNREEFEQLNQKMEQLHQAVIKQLF